MPPLILLGVLAALVALGALIAAPLASSARASTFRSILIDGDPRDWDGVSPALTDPAGDRRGGAVDLGAIFIANDERFLFLRFEVGSLVNLQGLAAPLRIYIDTDRSAATGQAVEGIGSDVLVEFSRFGSGFQVYEQTAAQFYAVQLRQSQLEAQYGPTVAATAFELRLGREAWLPQHAGPAFPGSSLQLVFAALDGGRAAADRAPDASGALSYELAAGTQPAPPDNDLARRDPLDVRILSYNTLFGGIFDLRSEQRTRILRAIQPDIIAFQELWDHTPGLVAASLDLDLPLGGGGRWQASKGTRGQITASRFPLTHDAAAPRGELGTLIDLPDGDHGRDLYVINSHFKCCGSIGTSEDRQRQDAADAIVAWIRELRTPGGPALAPGPPGGELGALAPAGRFLLSAHLNLVGGPGPLATLLTGDIADEGRFGADAPPDWDGTALSRAAPLHTDGFAVYTWRNDRSTFAPGKLDYIIYTDAVVAAGNRFVLNTLDMSAAKLERLGLRRDDTALASDHLPVAFDLRPAGGGVDGDSQVATPSFTLDLRATPNPFRQSTELDFELAIPATVHLTVYDVRGRQVRRLLRGPLPAGPYVLSWGGTNDAGVRVADSTYFLALSVRGDGFSRDLPARKLTILRDR